MSGDRLLLKALVKIPLDVQQPPTSAPERTVGMLRPLFALGFQAIASLYSICVRTGKDN